MTNTKFGWSLDSLFPFIYFFLAGIVYNSVVFFPNQFGKRRKKTCHSTCSSCIGNSKVTLNKVAQV